MKPKATGVCKRATGSFGCHWWRTKLLRFKLGSRLSPTPLCADCDDMLRRDDEARLELAATYGFRAPAPRWP